MPRFCPCGSIIAWHSSITSASEVGSLRQRQLAGLDLRQIQNFVDQLQQIPARVENLVNAGGLRGRWRRGIRIDELSETEDRIERRAQLMAHAGKEIGFREVRFFRRGPGPLQLDVIFLQRAARNVCVP